MDDAPVKVAILGAGMIGCWVGGHLARAADVTLIGRRPAMDQLGTGMCLTDNQGLELVIPAGSFHRATTAEAMAAAALVIVTVKSGATATAAAQIAAHTNHDSLVLSLQNGVSNLDTLRQALPGRHVIGGMVPYNVAKRVPGHFHRGTDGVILIEAHPAFSAFHPLFGKAGIPVETCPDILSVQWGKLLINLNNAINALSGDTLAGELSQRGYRRAWALALGEGLKLLRAANVRTTDPLSIPLRLMPMLLSLPDGLYRRVMAGGNRPRIDRYARSSMADDLERGRPTEVDHIQGELVRLAERIGGRAPVNKRLLELVKAAEAGAAPIPAAQLLAQLKQAQSAR